MSARPALLAALVLAAAGCEAVPHPPDPQTRPYAAGDLLLLARYTAKETCSCLFVMELDEDRCRAWTRASPPVATFSVDRRERIVRASALLFWRARARFLDERTGCVLE